MRVGVYGTGSIGKRHIANILAAKPDAQFIFFKRTPKEDEFSKQVKAKVEPELSDEIKNCDFAIVANPSAFHFKVLEKIILNNISAYIEKPVVTSLQQAKELEKLIAEKKYSAPTMVGCNLRFLNSLKTLKSLVAANEIGKPVRAVIEAGQWLPDWRPAADYRESYSAKTEAGGGVIFDLIHEIDLARWIFGEFDIVKSAYGKFSELEIETEDAASIILARKKGPIVSINIDYISRQPRRKISIIGDKGNLLWDMQSQKLQLETKGKLEDIDTGKAGFETKQTYIDAMAEFINSVETKTKTTQDIRQGLESAKLAIMAKNQ